MLQPNSDTQTAVLVDGHAVAFTAWYESAETNINPGFMSMLNSFTVPYENPLVIVAFDPPPPTFRHSLYPRYKANRPRPDEHFLHQCAEMEDTLQNNGILVIKESGFEADDVLGSLVVSLIPQVRHIEICTCDLDLLQLVDTNVSAKIFSQYWATRIFDVDAVIRRFDGLRPNQIPDLKALMGDHSDNLPGIPGIGPKAATRLLSAYPSIEDIYWNIDTISELPIRGSKRVQQLLINYEQDAYLMKTLTTIVRTIPINALKSATSGRDCYNAV